MTFVAEDEPADAALLWSVALVAPPPVLYCDPLRIVVPSAPHAATTRSPDCGWLPSALVNARVNVPLATALPRCPRRVVLAPVMMA